MRRAVLLTVLMASAGCYAPNLQQLIKRAAFDFDCPEAQITTVEMDSRSHGVKGCSKRGVYVWDCKPGGWRTIGLECTWIDNSPQNQTTRAPSSPAP